MNFAYPEFLYALFFLGIPILIHLFNFRKYKVVRFSQVKFLKEVKQHTKSTSRLKHILVLIARCLAIFCLVLAFAQPTISEKGKVETGKKGISIYVDNSYSMATKAQEGQLLDIAKNKAIKILDVYDETDKFQLVTNTFKATDQRWLNKESFLEELQSVNLSPFTRNTQEVINRQIQINNKVDYILNYFIISDLQKSSFSLDNLNIDSTAINLIPIEASVKRNVSIDSLNLENPFHLSNSAEKLNYTLKNYVEEKISDIPVRLSINNELKTPSKVSLIELEKAEFNLNFKSTAEFIQSGELVIKDFPITFDDTLFFNYEIRTEIKILHIYEENLNKAFSQLYAADSFFVYTQSKTKQINYDQLQNYNLVILDGLKVLSSGLRSELTSFIKEGGSVALAPTKALELESYNRFLESVNLNSISRYNDKEVSIQELNLNSKVFSGVFEEIPKQINLPKVAGYWLYGKNNNFNTESIIKLQNGVDFLSKYDVGKGKIYTIASPLDEDNSNFIKHAIFVPTFYRIALLSVKNKPSFNFFGDQQIAIEVKNSSENPVRLIKNKVDYIPKQRKFNKQILIDLDENLNNSGHYMVLQGQDTLGLLSLNYTRTESDLSAYSKEEVQDLALSNQINLNLFDSDSESLSYEIVHKNDGISLWKYFLILALAFILAEILLLRFLK